MVLGLFGEGLLSIHLSICTLSMWNIVKQRLLFIGSLARNEDEGLDQLYIESVKRVKHAPNGDQARLSFRINFPPFGFTVYSSVASMSSSLTIVVV